MRRSGVVSDVVSHLCRNADYLVTVSDLNDEDGLTIVKSVFDPNLTSRFTYQPIKVDSILNSMPLMYGKSLDSKVRQALSAIAIQDEEIGGKTTEQ